MDLTLNELVMSIVLGSLLIVSVLSVGSRLLHSRSEVKLARMRTTCRLCGHVFLNDSSGNLIHCPSCDALNRKQRNGKLG
ncbi:hypothetical protein ACFSSA_14860 [Luteolibacter algae]|uniref:Hydrogenase nickel incorporation protein HypA n=1 Tax=Luteolibacter algae TaxID=454151 RepID=A0ABW5DBG7_9BACT